MKQKKSITESGGSIKISQRIIITETKFGNYRIGIEVHNDIVEIMRVLHRKEFYRYFP